MSDQLGRRFDPGELGGPDGPRLSDADLADDLAMARDLELFARAEQAYPSSGFEDRVMAALADEPAPRGAFAATAGHGRRSIVAVVVDAWRVATTPGRPFVMRAQALAFVLVVALAIGSLGTVAAVGMANLIAPDASPTPTPTELPSPSPQPSIEPSPSLPPSPSPSIEPSPSPSPSPSDDESPEPTETPDDSEGSGSSATVRPTATGDDDDDDTPEPVETDEADDDSSGSGSDDDSSGSGSGSGSDDDD
jgi:hypothetical protein